MTPAILASVRHWLPVLDGAVSDRAAVWAADTVGPTLCFKPCFGSLVVGEKLKQLNKAYILRARFVLGVAFSVSWIV